jgi:hypothetical protein
VFIDPNKVQPAQYQTRHLNDYFFNTTQPAWVNPADYWQPWQTSDTIKLQFIANYSAIQVDLVDLNLNIVASFSSLNSYANRYQAGYYAYETSISLATVPPGSYRVRIRLNNSDANIRLSEKIILSDSFENTVLLEYANNRYHGDVLFETGIRFSMRVPGGIDSYDPFSKDVMFEDQILNPTQLSSKPYAQAKLILGDGQGLPDWVMYKMMWVWSCNDVTVDGKSFAKADGAKWEKNESEDWKKRGWSMLLREGINRGSQIFDTTGDPTKKLVVAFNIDGTVFGDISSNASSNIIQIQSVG